MLSGLEVRGALVQLGTETIDRANWDWDEVDRNPFFSPDPQAAATFLFRVRNVPAAHEVAAGHEAIDAAQEAEPGAAAQASRCCRLLSTSVQLVCAAR